MFPLVFLSMTPMALLNASPFARVAVQGSAQGEQDSSQGESPQDESPQGRPPRDDQYGRQHSRGEYGPFFEDQPTSDTAYASALQKGKKPLLSLGGGSFCFIDGPRCKASLLVSAGVGFGVRIPASDVGPDIPYSMFTVQGGVVVRPLMFGRRTWHPWGVGAVASWSRGTGSVTVAGRGEDQVVETTRRTDSLRIAVHNQLWLSKKPWGVHLDLSVGAVRSEVLTSGLALWGTHAEVGVGMGGWASIFAGADFLDHDARLTMGLRGHGLAAAPIIALALAGMALGGAL